MKYIDRILYKSKDVSYAVKILTSIKKNNMKRHTTSKKTKNKRIKKTIACFYHRKTKAKCPENCDFY